MVLGIDTAAGWGDCPRGHGEFKQQGPFDSNGRLAVAWLPGTPRGLQGPAFQVVQELDEGEISLGLAGVCFCRLREISLGPVARFVADLITVFTQPPDSPPPELGTK